MSIWTLLLKLSYHLRIIEGVNSKQMISFESSATVFFFYVESYLIYCYMLFPDLKP